MVLLVDRFDNKKCIVHTHIKAMFDIAPIYKESCTGLRSLLDNVLKHFRTLKALQRLVDSWDDMIIHLVLVNLDSVTVKEWEINRSDTDIPTFKQLVEFLSRHCQAVESVSSKSVSGTLNALQKSRTSSSHVATSNQSCAHCKENYFIFQCELFCKFSTDKRFKIMKGAHLCIKCLKAKGHQAKDYPSSSCQKCEKKHNTLLHFDNPKKSEASDNDQSVTQIPGSVKIESLESSVPVVGQCVRNSTPSKIYLSTAIVNVYDRQGRARNCRVLLDSGSQLNFITEKLANRLQIKGRAIHMSISGVAEGAFESKRMIRVKIQSKVNAYRDSIDCVVFPKLTQKLPQKFCPTSAFKIPSNIVLADPNFNVSANIDLLLRAQSFWQLLCVGQVKACEAHPTLQKTKLGWVISGMAHGSFDKNLTVSCNVVTLEELDRSIARFWEVK